MRINRDLAVRLERQFMGTPASYSEWLESHPDEKLSVRQVAGGWIAEPFVGASWGGGGLGLGFEGPISEADFQIILGAAARVGPRFRVAVCPYADMSLPRRLLAEGFAVEGFRTVLVRSVADAADLSSLGDPSPGITVRRIDPATELQLFIDTVSPGFNSGIPQSDVDRQMSRIAIRYSNARLFLAMADGQPAGGARFDLAGGVGFFLGGSVLPEFRNRGVHRALIVERIKAAAHEGCDLVTVGSPVGGATERNALRLGFEVAYTALELARGPL